MLVFNPYATTDESRVSLTDLSVRDKHSGRPVFRIHVASNRTTRSSSSRFPLGEPSRILSQESAIVYVLVEAPLLAARKMRPDSFLPPGHTEDNKGRGGVEECVKVVEGMKVMKIMKEERWKAR